MISEYDDYYYVLVNEQIIIYDKNNQINHIHNQNNCSYIHKHFFIIGKTLYRINEKNEIIVVFKFSKRLLFIDSNEKYIFIADSTGDVYRGLIDGNNFEMIFGTYSAIERFQVFGDLSCTIDNYKIRISDHNGKILHILFQNADHCILSLSTNIFLVAQNNILCCYRLKYQTNSSNNLNIEFLYQIVENNPLRGISLFKNKIFVFMHEKIKIYDFNGQIFRIEHINAFYPIIKDNKMVFLDEKNKLQLIKLSEYNE